MNISNDASIHKELIKNGVLDVINKYVTQFKSSAKTINNMGVDETVEGMDLDVLSVEDVQLIKCLIVVMLNFS